MAEPFQLLKKIATEAQLRTANSICPEAIGVYSSITLSSFIRIGWNLVFRFSVSSIVYVSRWIWLTIPKFITSEREARSEFLLIYTKNLSMSGRPARRPAGRPWSRFWEAYISGTVSPIDKRSSLVGSPIPSSVHGTNAESCRCLLWHVACATWGDVTNVPPAISR